ncbi:MAG: UDP-N-acetylmuramate--L-alanine ligase [Verrucomicrobia bacterium]|nr:MAG: UDP-N-acetylmuramate--L-alanine ligase [Verrucomicrobiota bacterium]
MPDFSQLERDLAAARGLLERDPSAVHFIGIGGIGMAGLARLLAARGFIVSGCDVAPTRITDWLLSHSITVHFGQDTEHVTADIAWLVRTPAVAADTAEVQAATSRGLPVLARGVVLAALLREFPLSIAVAGTHGKTTTTAMIAQLLKATGHDPAFAIGGVVEALGGVAGVGQGTTVVVEADESDGTLALYAPDIAVITNIEFDHMEHFYGEGELFDCFRRFARQARRLIFCADDPRAAALGNTGLSFGFSSAAELRAEHIELAALASSFDVLWRGEKLGRVRLPVPGRHNILNALAACAVGLELFPRLGKPVTALFQGLESFSPARRRFEIVSDAADILVISDYAHHPTEICALVAAARGLGRRRVVAVFQPHRYTRTRALGADFPGAFVGVDEVVLTPVYAASEPPLAGGTSADLARHFEQSGGLRPREVASLEAAWNYLRGFLQPGDALLVVGAGDVEKIAFWAKEFYGEKV